MRLGTWSRMAVVVLSAGACAHGRAQRITLEPPLPESSVSVAVTNGYGLPMDVYASGGGTVYRLGTVEPGIVGHFMLRSALLASGGEIQLYARPTGSGPLVRSGRLRPQPGDTVEFEIPALLRHSVATIRP